jgi:hypothetical protein
MSTTEENLEKITGYLERIADAAERIASSLEPAESEDDPSTFADDIGVIASCVSSEDGKGLCDVILKAARLSAVKREPTPGAG